MRKNTFRRKKYCRIKSLKAIKLRIKINKLKLRRKNINKKKRKTNDKIEVYKYKDLLFLRRRNFYKNKKKDKNKLIINIPEIFSLQKEPDDVLKLMKRLVAGGLNNNVKELQLNYSKCKEMTVETSLLVDIIVLNIEEFKSKHKINFNINITVEKGSYIEKMLKNTGLIKHLKFEAKEVDDDRIVKLGLIKGKNDKKNSSEISGNVIKFYDTCLAKHGFTLKKEGKQKLGCMIGEVLDNCYNHSGYFKSWYIIGYYTNDDNNIGECSIAIINFGDTIYEGIKKGTIENINLMENLAKKHDKLFLPHKWTRDNLYTLYSLQEGVSKMKGKNSGKDRGQGTKNLIESFQLLGNSLDKECEPIMTITTGNTHIRFDNRYEFKNRGDNIKVIAFNSDNDLNKRPDKRNVININNKFPGVIISMKFYIDKDYIKSEMER